MAEMCFRYYKKKRYPQRMSSATGLPNVPVMRSISQPKAGGCQVFLGSTPFIDGAKQALIENGPVFIVLPLYNSGPTFWKSNSNLPHDFHAVSIEGYDSNGFFFRNSWGTAMVAATCHLLTGVGS